MEQKYWTERDHMLVLLVKTNDIEELKKRALDYGLNDQEMYLLYFVAVKEGKTDIVKFLLNEKIDINRSFHWTFSSETYPDNIVYNIYRTDCEHLRGRAWYDSYGSYRGGNALILATLTKKTDIAKLLIEQGIDLNHISEPISGGGFYRAIHIAAMTGQHEIVAAILDKLPKLLNQYGKLQITPLMLAAEKGNLKTVEVLVQRKASFDGVLESVLKGNNADVLYYLIRETNILQNNIHKAFLTARHAITHGQYEVFALVFDKFPALVSYRDGEDKSLLDYVKITPMLNDPILKGIRNRIEGLLRGTYIGNSDEKLIEMQDIGKKK
ncbi:MAG: ankyrin repeat domain-containing protein [Pseudomonadota bacterium]|nr:ankyrin repeat domain-containing protein [Pseudomonadota bacterium]